jgi:hypothetical protein
MIQWNGPAFVAYTSKAARLRTYMNWPHIYSKLSLAALSEAVFFHAGKTLHACGRVTLDFAVLVFYISVTLSKAEVTGQCVSTVGADYIYGRTLTTCGKNMYAGSPSVFSYTMYGNASWKMHLFAHVRFCSFMLIKEKYCYTLSYSIQSILTSQVLLLRTSR